MPSCPVSKGRRVPNPDDVPSTSAIRPAQPRRANDHIGHIMNEHPVQPPVLGVLGGLGPLATVDFLEKLTRLTPAGRDQDHLPWLAFNQPGTPDRSTAILAGDDSPRAYLVKGVAYLAAQGVSLIAIPCNASHHWMPAMRAAVSTPILHIAEEAAGDLRRVHGPGVRAAVLGTRGTLKAGVYAAPLRTCGAHPHPLNEEEQTWVDGAIEAVKGGRIDSGTAALQKVVDALSRQDVDVAILACTELSVIWPRIDTRLPPVDASLALARGCLRRLGYLDR